MRQNHSYQVHYYDPQGLDATIYQPSLDLKFANDTGGALWFQTEWDDEAATLSVSVFGKARDFTVDIGKPNTLSWMTMATDAGASCKRITCQSICSTQLSTGAAK